MRARHVTYYTISDGKKFSARIERTTFRENNLVLAGDRTLGLPRVKRTICRLSYENQPKPNVGIEPTTSCSEGRRATIAPVRPKEKTPLEIGGIDPPTCRMRIDRSTT